MMTSHDISKSAYEVLNVHMKNQIIRIGEYVDNGPTRPSNTRKRPFHDITNTAVVSLQPSVATPDPPKPSTRPDDTTVLNEMENVLKHTHILKQWYLGILQQQSKTDSQDNYLLCKVVKKGVTDAEDHAMKVLDHMENYHIKRLELSSQSFSSQEENNTLEAEQKETTLKITEIVYAIKKTHMMKAIINIYVEFQDIALQLYEANK